MITTYNVTDDYNKNCNNYNRNENLSNNKNFYKNCNGNDNNNYHSKKKKILLERLLNLCGYSYWCENESLSSLSGTCNDGH